MTNLQIENQQLSCKFLVCRHSNIRAVFLNFVNLHTSLNCFIHIFYMCYDSYAPNLYFHLKFLKADWLFIMKKFPHNHQFFYYNILESVSKNILNYKVYIFIITPTNPIISKKFCEEKIPYDWIFCHSLHPLIPNPLFSTVMPSNCSYMTN